MTAGTQPSVNESEVTTSTEIVDDMIIQWDVGIPMSDGIVIRADVFRPAGAGEYPVLLSYGPYSKGETWESGNYPEQWQGLIRDHPEVIEGSTGRYVPWEVADPEKWVPDGYALVRADSRGAGRSPGFIDPFGPREQQDMYEAVEWVASQPWSDGKVGMAGISYLASTQWLAAAAQPPHLAAICPWEGYADYYREWCGHGGIPGSFFGNWMRKQVVTVQHGLGDNGRRNPNNGRLIAGPPTLSADELAANRLDVRATMLEHPLDDDWHRSHSADLSKVTVPLLSSANWGGAGLHPRGNFNGFTHAASAEKYLEVHGLEHWTHFYTDYGRLLQKRFFDYYLKGEDNGWSDQPPVLLQIRHVDKFVPRAEAEWPLARTQWTKYYLNPGAKTLGAQSPESESSAEFVAMQNHLTLLTQPFSEDVEITGPLAAKLFMSSSSADADLFLVVHLFDPDGTEVTFAGTVDPHTPIAQGWLRASHRKLDPARSTEYQPFHSHDEIQPLKPGTVYEVDVEIWPTCIVVPAGYRLGLSVRGDDYDFGGEATKLLNVDNLMRGSGPFVHDDPEFRPPDVYGGTTTVYGGGGRSSYLLVPVIPTTTL